MSNPSLSLDNRHKFALPFWANPNILSMAPKVEGGGSSTEELDDEDDEEDDDEDDDEDEDKTEEEIRAELKAVRKSIAKANGSSKVRRVTIKRLKAELAEARAKPTLKPAAGDNEEAGPTQADVDAAKEAGRREGNLAVISAKAETALSAAGAKEGKTARLTRLLDIDELDLNKDGSVDGLDEAIDELKEEYPELFGARPTTKRRSVAGDSDRDGERASKTGPTKLTATERQAQALVPGARLSGAARAAKAS